MKKLLSFACTLLLATVLYTNAHAYSSYQIDIDGAGAIAPIAATEYSDINGNSYVDTTFTSATDFTFVNSGWLKFISTDNEDLSNAAELTGIYNFSGVGSTTSGINFNAGTLSLYSDLTPDYKTATGFYGASDGTLIASFDLIGGSAAVIPGSAVPNGFVTLTYRSTFLASGYFLDEVGADLTDLDYILGFSTTNLSYLNNPTALIKSEMAQLVGHPITTNVEGVDWLASANGQVRLNAVPEPATVMLMGAGFLGLALIGRKKIVK